MIEVGPQNPYESYCFQCNVSAPVDARACVHCGGRLSRQRGVPASTIPNPFKGGAPPADEEVELGRLASASPMTAVWILLFLAGTVYRICA